MKETKTYIPFNANCFMRMELNVVTIDNTPIIRRTYLYTGMEKQAMARGFSEGKEFSDIISEEQWEMIRAKGSAEYSEIRYNRVNLTWEQLLSHKLYTAFSWNGLSLKQTYAYLLECYKDTKKHKSADTEKEYLSFRAALNEYCSKLCDGVRLHNNSNKQAAIDTLQERDILRNDVFRCRDFNRKKYEKLGEANKAAWLELAQDYGLEVPVRTYQTKQVGTFYSTGVEDAPLDHTDPHQFTTYHKYKEGDPLVSGMVRYKRDYVSTADEDLVLEALRWFRTHGDREWLETTQLADLRTFTKQTLRLYGVPEDSVLCEDDIKPGTVFYQDTTPYEMEYRDFLEPLHEDVEDVDNNLQYQIEDDVDIDESELDEDELWDMDEDC